MEQPREASYERNKLLEAQIGLINEQLKHLPPAAQQEPPYPTVCILGVPRSGTTLMLQWLASSGAFCYPTNFLSRFANAPIFGAQLQEMLFNPAFRFMDEFSDLPVLAGADFRSNLGKTSGFSSPHEFWYFWRRFFTFPDEPPYQESTFIERADFKGFSSECAGIQQVFGQPLAMKGLIANPYASVLSRNVPSMFFIYVRRSPLTNISSILTSRRKYFGTDAAWWSFKPPEYDSLKCLAPAGQVAGQWRYLNAMIQSQLSAVPQERQLTLDYEDLCKDPAGAYARLVTKLSCLMDRPFDDYAGPTCFPNSSSVGLTDQELAEATEVVGDAGDRREPA